jgi:FkbM family methyltransferase
MMTLSRSISSFGRLPRHLWLASKALFVFRRALTFLARYMRWNWPIAEPVELRNGVQIYLSAPDDIATLVEVFLRRQYGPISSEAVVVDVGANIGVFSLFALAEGARLVHALEPSAESFEILRRNIRVNGAESRIHAERVVVAATSGDMVKFPVASSRENAVIEGETTAKFQMTPTETLESLLNRYELQSIDLLKLDCEGSEREILLSTLPTVWRRIRDIRLEFHYQGDRELLPFLSSHGYALVKHQRTGSAGDGIMWFAGSRPSTAAR